MDYRLTIAQGEDIILDKLIDADTVIALMRPVKTQGGVHPEEHDTVEVRPRPAEQPKVVRNGKPRLARKGAFAEDAIERARKLLISGMSYGEVAEKLGVNASTLYNTIPKSSIPKA